MAEFTEEQFGELINEVENGDNAQVASIGSCTARYGGERDSSVVEEFIADITTFKLREKLTDNEVLVGMPTLLWGEAAVWWLGAKNYIGTFEKLVQKFREAFSPLKPAWRIYAEMFESRQQKSEPTESFLRKKRALFAKLAKPPAESEQIDIIYGFLHTQIKERVFRHRVVNFDELVKQAREAEETLNVRTSVSTDNSSTGGSVRCSHCRAKGHTADACFKRGKLEAQARQAAFASIQATGLKGVLACYGCNAPGVIRSNCPKCNTSQNPLGSDIPIVNVQMFGVPGQAYIDTGARTSVASENLRKFLDFYGCTFREQRAEVALADDSKSLQKYLSTTCKIEVGGKNLDISFVMLHNSPHNRTLLGSDFLEQAGIVLNMGQRYWYFETDPIAHFDFEKAWPIEMNLLETITLAKKSENTESTGASVEPLKRKAVEELINRPKQRQRNSFLSEFE